MPRKAAELTRMPMPTGVAPRWRKIYKGHNYYFRGTYAEALGLWEAKKVDLDGEGRLTKLEILKVGALRVERDIAKEVDTVFSMTTDQQARTYLGQTSKAESKSIGQAVEMFLSRQRGRVSTGHHTMTTRVMEHFAETIGRRLAVSNINALTLTDYRLTLDNKIKAGWSADYAASYGRIVRTFLGWLYRNELTDRLPRNLDELQIEVKAKKITTFTKGEITALLGDASERTKLYLLLMLNTGMTQKDISDLTPDEVNLKKGIITRKRSKTKDCENVPEVTYPLWGETLRLMKQFAKPTGETALTNEDGGKLLVETTTSRTDNIRMNYRRLLSKLATKKVKISKPLKIFRKTSASLLEDSAFPQCASYFLGHSPKGVGQINYLATPQATMVKAVQWLGTQYGVK